MEAHGIGTRPRELVEEPVGRLDLEVRVEGPIRVRAQRGHHHRTDREGRDEVSVHDVDMDEVGMLTHELDLLGQTGEVGRQDGRAQLGHGAILAARGCSPAEGRDEHRVAAVRVRPEADPFGGAVGAGDLDGLELGDAA